MKNRKLATKSFLCVIIFGMVIFTITLSNNSIKSQKNLKIGSQTNAINKVNYQSAAFENRGDGSNSLSNLLDAVVGITSTDNDSSTQSVGSGFIVSENGYIATNYHVVGTPYSNLSIAFSNGKVMHGKMLWGDPILDLAIVKVDATGLTPAILGDAKTLIQGQPAYAIGNPLGLQFQRTVTSGIISALNRTITVEYEGEDVFMEDLIQTDASINPGNSGGPLANSDGAVVGINTVKVSSAEGIGFAVPINIIKPIIDSFVKTGSFKTPYVGIYGYDKNMAQYLNQNFNHNIGVMIASIESNSPAEKAGFLIGDIITHINKKPVNTMLEVREIIYSAIPGDEVIFTVIRNSKLQEIKITL
ncbi:MAG: trypsin-like peptidase domain-containing protein [Clostridia bacterium]|nr:trypsin-like peptidase domain-containing protein [Clostridia bacterium]